MNSKEMNLLLKIAFCELSTEEKKVLIKAQIKEDHVAQMDEINGMEQKCEEEYRLALEVPVKPTAVESWDEFSARMRAESEEFKASMDREHEEFLKELHKDESI